ncbi:MAG: DivIVA domain-containing protein [Nakamurella sp.]
MRLTPAEVHNVSFKKPSIGKRGYDEDEVDAFLDLVEDELARLIEENNALTAQLSAAGITVETRTDEEAIAATPLPTVENAAPAEPDVSVEPAEPAGPVVVPAPVAAPMSTADAGNHAARLLGLAQETADRLTAEARAEAEATRAAAAAESERVRTEAQTFSDDLLAEAQTKADTIDADARTQKDTVLGELTTQRTELEQKIDGLRTYEREYRSRLKIWITDQLNQLDGNPAAASAEA